MWRLPKDQMFFFCFEYLFRGWVVANHKSSKCLALNDNPHEPLVKNLINPFMRERERERERERLLYLKMLALFFCVLSAYLLYFSHLFFSHKK